MVPIGLLVLSLVCMPETVLNKIGNIDKYTDTHRHAPSCEEEHYICLFPEVVEKEIPATAAQLVTQPLTKCLLEPRPARSAVSPLHQPTRRLPAHRAERQPESQRSDLTERVSVAAEMKHSLKAGSRPAGERTRLLTVSRAVLGLLINKVIVRLRCFKSVNVSDSLNQRKRTSRLNILQFETRDHVLFSDLLDFLIKTTFLFLFCFIFYFI